MSNNNNNQCNCNCNPGNPEINGGQDINMAVCEKNMQMLPMLQTYNTIVLKPNMCCKKNILTQQMLSCEDTKYVIRWDYDLNGQTITVPERCILEFDGGSLKNGTIIGQDTVFINVGDVTIWAENLTREGTWREHSGSAGSQVQSDWNQTDDTMPDYIKNKPQVPENVLVKWHMLDNDSNNRDNSTDPCLRYAGSKGMLSLVGLDEVYFEQTVKDLQPIFNKNYIIAVKFQWYNESGSWVQTDGYVNLNTSDGHFAIPEDAVGGYVTYNLYLSSHQANITKEIIEAAEILTNIEGEGRLVYNENAPSKWMADQERYKDSLYIDSLLMERLGYSKWRIGDSQEAENSVWLEQYAGLLSDYIIDLGKYTKYNAIVVTGDDTYRCWFTFVTAYPKEVGETVQQSSVYGNYGYYVHTYVQPMQTLTRVIPSDAKYLVVSWRHGNDEQLTPTSGYFHPKSIRFINTNVNKGALSYAKIVNDNFNALSYSLLANSVNKTTNRLNELKICSWNIGHYSMGEYPYSTITDEEEDEKAQEYQNFIRSINPDILLFNEFEQKFSTHYTSEVIFGYRLTFDYYKDRYCCQAMYSKGYMQLVDVVYFPYNIYRVDNGFGDAMDYFCVYRTYINDHAITIASVHLRSGNETMNERQCQYLISYLSGYWNVLILGDFNRDNMAVFTNAGYTVKITESTHDGGGSLDHFVYRGSVSIKEEHVVQTSLSDHYPIVATLTTTDNIPLVGNVAERPSGREIGFQYFDTVFNRPIYYAGSGVWVDGNGNIVSGFWKTLGVLGTDSVSFDGHTVTVSETTYSSSWNGWANANGTINRTDYVIDGNPFTSGDTICIEMVDLVKNMEWNVAFLDSNNDVIDYLVNDSSTALNTYNVDRKIVLIPTVANVSKVRIRIACDTRHFDGKISITKKTA